MDPMQERALAELRRYAANRLKDVARGAETRELAGLLVEKYGYGLAKALASACELAGQVPPDLARDIEAVVREVDPRRGGAPPQPLGCGTCRAVAAAAGKMRYARPVNASGAQ